jgi:hypothetical protein
MKAMTLIVGIAALTATAATAEHVTRTVTVDKPNYEGTRVTVRDKAEGTVTRDTDVTRKSDGATASRDYSRDRTETGVVASGSATGFNGKTRSFDYERTRTDSGFTANGNATGRNGQTYDYSADRTRTDTGYVSNRNVVNGDGRTLYNRDVAVNRSGGNVTRSVDVTRAKGFHRPQVARRGIGGGRRH